MTAENTMSCTWITFIGRACMDVCCQALNDIVDFYCERRMKCYCYFDGLIAR